MRILTAEQARAADAHAIEVAGIPALVLMENAGAEIVRALEDAWGEAPGLRVLVLCGTGNNGGDGMVAARRLAALGASVRALLLGDVARLSPDAAHQWEILGRLGLDAEACDASAWEDEAGQLDHADVVVDALFGTGFRGRLEGLVASVVEDVNDSAVPVLAVDVPSGLSGSSGDAADPVVHATLTVALQAPKLCHVFAPGSDACGDVVVAGIGIPDGSLRAAGSALELVEEPLVAALVEPLAHRPAATHKGDCGHVLVAGGSLSRSGAVALAGLGALRGGAGLVTVASPLPCVPIVAGHAPELMHAPLPADAAGDVAEAALDASLLDGKTVAVVGPGLGAGAGAARLLRDILEQARIPLVLDADALNLLALHGLPAPRADRPLVLTPHPGELARLARALGRDAPGEAPDERIAIARELAARIGGVVVVKGFRTLVVDEGPLVHVNPTGGPGLATGGTGDVLAGLLGALLAQGLPPSLAAIAATFLHGRAGDLAEEELGQMSLAAGDVVRFLPAAIASLFADAEDADDDEIPDDGG